MCVCSAPIVLRDLLETGMYPVDTYNENLLKWSNAVEELTEALRELHDVQNGPPTARYEAEWKEAMRKAGEALKKHES